MDFMDSISSVLFSAELTPDNRLTITYCNQPIQRYFGVSSTEVTRNAECLLHCLSAPHQQAFMACIARAIREQIPSECECEVNLGDQPARWLWVQITPQHTPTGVTASGVISDISAAHTAKLDALESASFFMQLQDSLPDIFYYKNQHSVFLGGNKAWCAHHGYDSLSEIIGKSDSDSKTI